MAQQHSLEIYEPYDYEGANPICLRAIGIIKGPVGNGRFLLEVVKPFEYREELIQQVLVNCRYQEDSIQRPVSSGCTVNIARVRSHFSLSIDSELSYEQFTHWGVGKITPNNC